MQKDVETALGELKNASKRCGGDHIIKSDTELTRNMNKADEIVDNTKGLRCCRHFSSCAGFEATALGEDRSRIIIESSLSLSLHH